MKVPKINFIEIEQSTELEHNFIYVGIVFNEEYDGNGYETLKYDSGTKEFLIWNGEESEYEEMSEHQEVVSIAKLSKYGTNDF